ncbi:SDR family oxidoreductase [Rhizobium sp. TRM96647]|uniref:Nucleoside-diphosphate-sugar epimerase n=1 Tax=Mycoplana azooxidifex TaxID=1636188 RepID=A0A7W6GL99_9HYPH|nr:MULTISPECIES: SDR family oxidoreductase [Rhizobiaceae]MBB3979936.1 nucleoside-diphosphate-sugar epimerase [Mycoplana azooxidifex]MCV3738926.1 SDR family oxidoreductase [Rhizobium sp. TRM96647]MCV3760675.1 SDR family oxidoreductase [Rhizobium sp. TRM96650]
MKMFITGATGFVGSAVVRELLAQGYQVLGLARSDRSADALAKMGAEVLRGDLEMPETLRQGARTSDGIIHTGFVHDFSRFAEACAIDRTAIETLGAAIESTQKPFIVTAGVAFLDAAGPLTVEADPAFPPSGTYPRASEAAAKALSDRGIPTSIMRLPPSVHGKGDHGFVPMLIDIARRTGRSAYIGDGHNAWPAVHVDDAARAFRLAVEGGASAETYHAVAEQGIPFREIAEAIAGGLGIPCVSLSVEEAQEHFGWFFGFASIGQPASSDWTRARLNWNPTGPGLLADIIDASYFDASAGQST